MLGSGDSEETNGEMTRRLTITLLSMTGFGALLGLLGPFGSYANAGALARIAYWVGVMWIGFTFYGASVITVLWLTKRMARWLTWSMLAVGALIASIPQAFVSRAVASAIWPASTIGTEATGQWYIQTSIIGLLATFGVGATVGRAKFRLQADAPAPATIIHEEVIALQMEDHYVRFHTPYGSRLELMTLAGAMAKIGNIDGLRTHRSWWVARDSVVEIKGSTREMKLLLKNGTVAPVARSAVAQLRHAGWLVDYDQGKA